MNKLQPGKIMSHKTVLNILLVIITACSLVGCQHLSSIIYEPEIKQGKSIRNSEIAQLKTGMSKNQVVELLGTPSVINTFNNNEWAYLRTIKLTHEKTKHYKALVLKFNQENQLTHISKPIKSNTTKIHTSS